MEGKDNKKILRIIQCLRYLTAIFVCFAFFGALLFTENAYALTPTQIYFPLPNDRVWYGSTYQGHGKDYDTLRTAMDITYTGGSAEGYTVYAMGSGTVVSRDDSNGQIVVKVSTPLITTNGAYIGSWYYCYAHMKNISVSAGNTVQAGQSVGQVSMVGNATGPHLHVNIASADYGGSIWSNPGTQYAISPYYVYGFVDASGNDVWYFNRDKEGPAVTEWLINHVPVSTSAVPDTSAPVVVSAEAQNVTENGFDVVCRITDNIGVTSVSFAVWNGGDTANDQDDIQWYTINSLTSGTATDGVWTCHVDISNHHNERTVYFADIRAYDAIGNVNNPYTHLAGIQVKQPITSIRIDRNSNLWPRRGETEQLTVITEPEDYDQSKLVWTSSNDALVSVTNTGLVTAHHLSDDRVTIKCATPDGSVYDEIDVDVITNVDDASAFYVDRVPAGLTDLAGSYGLVAMIREPGDMLECSTSVLFVNDVQSCDIEYKVEEGNIILNNGTLFVGKNTADKNVVAVYVYDKYDDGTRGPELARAKITIFKEISGSTFTLPESLLAIGENAFEGVAAKKYILPDSLTSLAPNSLAGLPKGSRIYFNSNTIEPFYDVDVLGLPDTETRTTDYDWLDTGSFTTVYFDGAGGTANYYYLADQVEYYWSDWTTTVPTSGTEYESKTQYRSRNIDTETVYSEWGDWVSNGTTAIDSNDLREIRTINHPAQTKTVYTYDHYKYYNTSSGDWYYSYADTSGNSWSSQGRWESVESDTPYTQYKWASSDGYDGWRDSSTVPWFHQGTKQVTTANAYTEYQYRTRTTSQETTYGEWSDWGDASIMEIDTLDVEARTVYRMKVYH